MDIITFHNWSGKSKSTFEELLPAEEIMKEHK